VRQKKGSNIGIYSPDELRTFLENIEDTFVPDIAIGAFAGLRSAEIARLDWSEVKLDRGHIEIKASKAKTASRRLIPIVPALKAWLETHKKTAGQIIPCRDEFHLGRKLKAAIDRMVDAKGKPLVQTVPNGFRHSFCTYRLAVVKSAAQVALEAGNSPKMLFEHYRELATEEDGNAWFGIMPLGEKKVVDFKAA
jgi:integrase